MTSRDNAERMDRVRDMIDAYPGAMYGDNIELATDMIADILHMCKDTDEVNTVLRRALMHWTAETTGDPS